MSLDSIIPPYRTPLATTPCGNRCDTGYLILCEDLRGLWPLRRPLRTTLAAAGRPGWTPDFPAFSGLDALNPQQPLPSRRQADSSGRQAALGGAPCKARPPGLGGTAARLRRTGRGAYALQPAGCTLARCARACSCRRSPARGAVTFTARGALPPTPGKPALGRGRSWRHVVTPGRVRGVAPPDPRPRGAGAAAGRLAPASRSPLAPRGRGGCRPPAPRTSPRGGSPHLAALRALDVWSHTTCNMRYATCCMLHAR